MAKVVKEREMAVPLEALFGVITDFESYPQFMSEVIAVKRHPGGSATKQVVTFELELIKKFTYTLEFTIKPNESCSWKLVESNFFKSNDGAWIVRASGKDRTQATYELDVAFGFMVPGWISKKLTETNLPRMMENFENRTKSILAKAGK